MLLSHQSKLGDSVDIGEGCFSNDELLIETTYDYTRTKILGIY